MTMLLEEKQLGCFVCCASVMLCLYLHLLVILLRPLSFHVAAVLARRWAGAWSHGAA